MAKKTESDKRQAMIKTMCEENPDEVMKAMLEAMFWPKAIVSGEAYRRFDDDTYKGKLTVYFSPDGDAWIDIFSEKDREDPFTHRFRTYFGGGQSMRVRNALLFLAVAIKLDNEEVPQNRE